MRSLWKGSISFGLVNIPVKAYLATEDHRLEFDMLHKKDLSPIRYARICKLDGKEIPYDEIVKGYEVEKGEYIALDAEDFKKANVRKTSTIEISSFTDVDHIDPIYYERPYYLEPDKKAQKAYKVLLEALKKSKKVAVGSFVFHNKEHFGIIKPAANALILIQMRYAASIRNADNLELPQNIKTSTQELNVALQLIKQLSSPFKPEKFKDTYTEDLIETINEKKRGSKKRVKPKEKAPTMKSGDLMHLLKASLDKSLKEEKEPTHKPLVKKTRKKPKTLRR